ncbi:MAG TPA: DUF4360 domain-containing protein [Pilimelia sp.]|nr:DUF4360 domain-containing protein [Pilimelia sp.]
MNKSFRIAAAGLAALCAGTLVAAPAPAAPARAINPEIEVLGVSGSGCTKDSTSVVTDPDGNFVTAIYDGFSARTPATPALKACTVNLKLTVPQGHRVGLRRAAYAGEAVVRSTGKVEFKAKYFFQGSSKTEVKPGWTQDGSYDGSWGTEHVLDNFWGPRCGGQEQLIITQNLKSSGAGTNLINLNYATMWDFAVERC